MKKSLTIIASLLLSGTAMAAESDYGVFINKDTIMPNGAYKTITYRICSYIPNTSNVQCSAPISVNVQDSTPEHTEEAAVKVPLKAGEFISVANAEEKDKAGNTLVSANYLMNGNTNDDDLSHTYCEGGKHTLTVFSNTTIDANTHESAVTCQDNLHY